MIKNVIKRDGSIEPFQSEKLNLWAEWAAGSGVDWSSVTIGAYKKCHDNCTTADIQQALISECIDRATSGHLKMAGRLYISDMYKNIFGGIDKIPTLKAMYHTMTLKGLWANMSYSDEELDYLETIIDHSIDFSYIYSQLKQLVGKYGISDRTTGEYFETPQFTYMRFCMGSMNNTKREDRLNHIKNLYYLISNNKINAPTPYVLNFGTGYLGLASCALYTAHDDLLSLSAGDHIAYMMTAASSGLGSHIMTRSIKDPVRGGTIAHQGRLPYYKSLESATGANRQNGRGGACNTFYSVLDPEVLDIIGLRNPTSIDEKRIPDLDYTVSYNRFFAEKAAANEDWMLISYLHASDLWQAMYSPDQDLFSDLYYKYFNDDTVPKKILKARDIAFKFLKEAPQTGRAYTFDASEANTHTPFLDKIYSSNLCVAPETKILTKFGHIPIVDLVGQYVDVWNGFEWSNVLIMKTGSNQKLITVNTDSGHSIDCTPYHKFYVKTEYHLPPQEKRANELLPGDKLIKFELPCISGDDHLDNAYINGFYSADGCLTPNGQRIYLYDEKLKLKDMFIGGGSWIDQPNHNRSYKHYNNLKPKFFVPSFEYSIASKMEWLSGYLDGDGCIHSNGVNQQITACSINHAFLSDVQMLLQSLGISSKITCLSDEGYKDLPANDGTGKNKSFFCQKSYRLLIPSNESQDLLSMGLNCRRLNISVNNDIQRSATRFVKVASVIDNGRIDDTYCFNEPKRHMGVFNGVLTGQCTEIFVPTAPFEGGVQELYSEDSNGEIGLCNLMAIVLGRVKDDAEYAMAAYYCLLVIDEAIHSMTYPFKSLEVSAKGRMSAGVGLMNLAYDMANKGFYYSAQSGKEYMHYVAERHAYFLYEASLKLGIERGNAPWMHKTKIPEGWLPIDTYNKNVDKIVKSPLTRPWEDLRARIIENKGTRFSVVCAYMPGESSSIASNTTNSIYPVRKGVVIKTNGNDKNVFIAPDWEELGSQYELAWDISNLDLIDMYAIFQKFTDQGVSADLYILCEVKDGKRKVSLKRLFTEWIHTVRVGLKSRYYMNIAGAVISSDKEDIPVSFEDDEKGCAGGACTL